MKKCVRATLVAQRSLSPRYFRLELDAPAIAETAQPGQFVQVRCTDGWDPLLRRPFSLHDADPGTGQLSLLIGELGRGSHLLRSLPPGASLDVLGPLGRGWRLRPEARTGVLVGGGVGLPPLHFLAKRWLLSSLSAPSPPPPRIIAVLGARSREEVLCEEELASYGAQVRPATDDGSYGFPGTAVDLLAEVLQSETVDQIFTCGPRPMMRGVAALASQHAIPCQVSLEERMACGLGACISCAVPVRPGGVGPSEYQRVCTEGPVFEASEVFEGAENHA